MKEANCDVIRDLLPLYEDGAVSEETAKLVAEAPGGLPRLPGLSLIHISEPTRR